MNTINKYSPLEWYYLGIKIEQIQGYPESIRRENISRSNEKHCGRCLYNKMKKSSNSFKCPRCLFQFQK